MTRFASRYGMLGVLLLLGALFSILTLQDQHSTGAAAAEVVSESILAALATRRDATVLIVGRRAEQEMHFATALEERLRAHGVAEVMVVAGEPVTVRRGIEQLAGSKPFVVAALERDAPIVASILATFPTLTDTPVLTPPAYRWPTFLLADNLRNIAQQIAVIAILAIGMTMVIITAGIDLSVGSLIALAAVVVAWIIQHLGGAEASAGVMFLAGLGAVIVSGLIGAFSGLVITRFGVPPFIATLGMMQVASGLAYIISRGRPVYQVPEGFVVLGRGNDPLLGIPFAVLLMVALYVIAHLLMSHTKLGRYIYAVGGNEEAARLAGVRVKAVKMFVFTICGLLAGLGGIVMASQLKSGAPTYGLMYELYVIAAVVVGGTSLSGGEGRIFGTLIGAFIIAVIQNGMNLTDVESYTQKVVLGLVILGAVLLDRLRHRGWWGSSS